MSRLTRDGTAEPVSQDQILSCERGHGIFIFPVQLTTSRIGNLTRLMHSLPYVMTIHTYILTVRCIFSVGIILGILLGVVLGIILGIILCLLGIVLGIILYIVLGIILDIVLGIALGIVLGIVLGTVLGIILGIVLGIILGTY